MSRMLKCIMYALPPPDISSQASLGETISYQSAPLPPPDPIPYPLDLSLPHLTGSHQR
jgi:hypothetical protein